MNQNKWRMQRIKMMMVRTTFIFKTIKSFNRVMDALNESMYPFCSFKEMQITVFGEPAARILGEELDRCRIKYDIAK